MATQTLPEGTARNSYFLMDPETIVIDDKNRGRAFDPNDEDVLKLAVSMIENDQINPVEVRRVGDEYHLNSGFHRTMAARLIRKGFTYKGQQYKKPSFKITALPHAASDEQAFKRNIVENNDRVNTSIIDDALNMERLRKEFKMSDKDIAATYKCDPSRVSKLKSILKLSLEQQEMVHRGDLTLQAGLDLLARPEEERVEILRTVHGVKGKAKTALIRKEVRKAAAKDNEKTEAERAKQKVVKKAPATPAEAKAAAKAEKPAKATGTKSLSVKEIKEYFAGASGETDSAALRKAFQTIVKFIEGQVTQETMDNKLADIEELVLKAEPQAAAKPKKAAAQAA